MTQPDKSRSEVGSIREDSAPNSAEITSPPRKALLDPALISGPKSDEITLAPGEVAPQHAEASKPDRLAIEVHRPGGVRQRPVFMGTGRLLVGRTQGEIQLADRMVSHQHAAIEWEEGQAPVVHDLGSTNGTFLNGKRLSEPATLQDKDEIRIGSSFLSIRIPKH
jgi:hypothetical protein